MRSLRYVEVADQLRRGLGLHQPGALLPSESELADEHGVSRVTVRKALELLRAEGLVDSRQGYGWFVVAEPVRQTLGRLQTIEASLAARGVKSTRRVLDFGFVRPSRRVRAVFGDDAGSVLRVRRLHVADGRPFARVTVWVPESLGAGLSRRDVESAPITSMLGVALGGGRQTIGAAAASSADASVLGVEAGSPVLRCERVTFDSAESPVLLSEWVFPAGATEFVVDLPVTPPDWRT